MSAVYQAKIKTGGKVRMMVLQAENEDDARAKFLEITNDEQVNDNSFLDPIKVELFVSGGRQ